MKQLFRPTLVRRVFGALLIASLLLWLVSMALDLFVNLGDDKTGQELRGLSTYLADGLADIDNPVAAQAFVRGAIGETRRDAYNWRNFRFIKYELKDQAGRLVASNLAPGQPALGGATGSVEAQRIDGRRYLVARHETGRWSMRTALPMHTVLGILRDDWADLTLQVLIVFPFIFIPAWLAVARGLRPLRLLSEKIAARGADQLTPIDVDPKYEELKPLVEALDSLLLQLRNKVSREHGFVQDAAHELRTPLAVISAQAHVLGMAASAGERRAAEQQMDDALARAAHLISQLLELARLDGKAAGAIDTIDVAGVLRQELARRAPAALQRKLVLSLEAPDSLRFALEPQVFLSVLHNLVDNALRYVQEGGCVLVELQSHQDGLVLSVADNGPGIPDQHRALIFERFHRIIHDDVPGSGLGLAIARQAAARMNGTIELSRGLDARGCRFTLTLPTSP